MEGIFVIMDGFYPFSTTTKITQFLAFGVWEFDITRIIYPTATVDEILNGWNTLVAKRIPMDLLFLSLYKRCG